MSSVSREDETEKCNSLGIYTASQCETFGRCVTVEGDYATGGIPPMCYPDDTTGSMICTWQPYLPAVESYCYTTIGDPISSDPIPPTDEDGDPTPPDDGSGDQVNPCDIYADCKGTNKYSSYCLVA